ncbi:MAG: hypothetical protein ACOC58_05540 [Chloroflexota bacterium]
MGISAEEADIGTALSPVTRVARNTARGKGVHDDGTAKTLGFERAPVPGVTILGYVIDILLAFFGERWVEGGEIDLAFTRPLYEGQQVTARGTIRDKEERDEGLRLFVDVWAESNEGQKVAEGTASGLVMRSDSR